MAAWGPVLLALSVATMLTGMFLGASIAQTKREASQSADYIVRLVFTACSFILFVAGMRLSFGG